MCGIAGLVKINSFFPKEKCNHILQNMTDVISHRGPDTEGHYVKSDVALGHRRLSIIDIDGGAQPMSLPDKSVTITYNGEIYNYLILKDILEKKGHKFYTNSDTEVILHAYREFGLEFIHQIDGMYAFGLWDNQKKKLILATDPFGKKPLYYCSFNGIFYFASELKSLKFIPGFNYEIDDLSLHQYLCYEYIPSPRSIYKNIYKLNSGSILILKSKQINIKKYWDFGLVNDQSFSNKSEDTIINELDELLHNAVKKRLISDVPLGVFLSGGIDSSMITAYMSEILDDPREIKTFSIGFNDPSFDESNYARKVSRLLGTTHFEEILSPQKLLDFLPEVINKLDEPFADASLIPTSLLSQFTSKHVTVALGGDGGDELFFGYPTFQATVLSSLYRLFPDFIDGIIKRFVKFLPVSHNNISLDFKIKQFLKAAKSDIRIYQQIWLGALDYNESNKLMNSNKYTLEEIYEPNISIYKDNLSAINNVSETYVKTYLKDDILVKVDRASMAYSLETRAPLLDKELASYIMKLPADYKMKGFTTKYILKKLLKDRLPQEIIKRPKKGFGIPVAKWFNGPLKHDLRDTLSMANLKKTGFFNPNMIKILLDEHFNNVKDNRKVLWALYIFQKWALK